MGTQEKYAIQWQYLHGVPDPSVVDPDAWEHDISGFRRPGNDEIQLALFGDYRTNRDLYPAFHEWLRSSGVPVLVIWGKNDEIFGPAGAEAFQKDAPHARIELLDGGHFLLQAHLEDATRIIREWRASF